MHVKCSFWIPTLERHHPPTRNLIQIPWRSNFCSNFARAFRASQERSLRYCPIHAEKPRLNQFPVISPFPKSICMHIELGLSLPFSPQMSYQTKAGLLLHQNHQNPPAQYACCEARLRQRKISYPICGEIAVTPSSTNVARKFAQTEVRNSFYRMY